MYDYVAPLAKNPAFYSSDDTLTVTLQPRLIKAQREISVLELKVGKSNEKIKEAAAKRATAFTPATNWQEKIVNTAKSTAMAGNEAINSTELSLIHAEIKHHKEQFGAELYQSLEKLEDTQQFLPADREIRSIYDNCRRDIEKARERKVAKEQEIKELEGGGSYNPGAGAQRTPTASVTVTQARPVVYPSQQQPTSYSVPVPAPPQQPQVVPPPAPPVASYSQQSMPDPFASQQSTSYQDPFAAPAPTPDNDPFSLSAYAAQKDQFSQQHQPVGSSHAQSYMSSQQQQHDPFMSAPQHQQQHDPFMSAPQHQQHHDPFMSAPQPQQNNSFMSSSQQPQQTLTMNADPFASLSAQPMGGHASDPFAPVGGGAQNGLNNPSSSGGYQDPFASLQ